MPAIPPLYAFLTILVLQKAFMQRLGWSETTWTVPHLGHFCWDSAVVGFSDPTIPKTLYKIDSHIDNHQRIVW